MSIGLGQGSAGVTCPECEVDIDDRVDGLSGYLRAGAYLSPNVLLGLEGTGWMHNDDGFERRIAAASLVLLTYPSARAGFFLRGGFGGIRAVIENDLFAVVGEGLTWQVGTGWDIAMGPIALTPWVTWVNSLEVAPR